MKSSKEKWKRVNFFDGTIASEEFSRKSETFVIFPALDAGNPLISHSIELSFDRRSLIWRREGVGVRKHSLLINALKANDRSFLSGARERTQINRRHTFFVNYF